MALEFRIQFLMKSKNMFKFRILINPHMREKNFPCHQDIPTSKVDLIETVTTLDIYYQEQLPISHPYAPIILPKDLATH